MRISTLATCILAVSGSAYGAIETASVAALLESIGINPSSIPSLSSLNNDATSACAILRAINETWVVTASSNDTLYTAEADENWSATGWGTPRCIYTPSTSQGISLAVLVSRLTNVPFAVRSGGHTPNPGFANIGDTGFLITTTGLTDLEYNATSQTQRSGFGNRWEDIYGYLAQFNRIVVGGRTGTVGLALTLGGGLSHLSNAYGWAAQNVISYEVVLANGSIVTASETSYPDLFFALKGGSSNFGIVTHITQLTYPMAQVWGGVVAFPSNISKEFMSAMSEFQTAGQLDTKAAILPYIAPINDTILATFVYFEPVEYPDAFAPFYQLSNLSDATRIYESFYDIAILPVPSAVPRWLYGSNALKLDNETYVGLIDVITPFQGQISQLQGGTLLLMPQPISLSMVRESLARGVDPLNVTETAQLWASPQVGFINEADQDTANNILESMINAIDNYTQAQDTYLEFTFLNDAHFSQNPLADYGEGRYANLQNVARKYDPTGVFQRLLPGGFKLF